MAKITRVTQKLFASTPGANEVGVFGSLYNSSPTYSTDPATIMAQTNWLVGWYQALVGGNAMATQDINAVCKVFAYQLGYILQEGVSEWDSGTTYYTGSVVNDGNGLLYRSIADTNLNNAVTSATWWVLINGSPTVDKDPSVTSPYTILSTDNNRTFDVNSVNAAMTFVLPTPSNGFIFTVKDTGGVASINNITFQQHASEQLEGVASSFSGIKDFGVWTWYADGTNWWLK